MNSAIGCGAPEIVIQRSWLSHFLFIHTRQTIPDGRPLYGYKCRDQEYEELKRLILDQIRVALKGRPPFQLPTLFCLFAAETWRRKHEGGPWKWETIFSDIGVCNPNHSNIREWVAAGLKYWRRPLLTSRCGHTEYLLTIACEGGLPLRLLQKDKEL